MQCASLWTERRGAGDLFTPNDEFDLRSCRHWWRGPFFIHVYADRNGNNTASFTPSPVCLSGMETVVAVRHGPFATFDEGYEAYLAMQELL